MNVGEEAADLLRVVLDSDPKALDGELAERYPALDEVLAGRRRAIVYPAARLGIRAATWLLDAGADVVALGDRDGRLQGTKVRTLPVIGPEEIAANYR